MVNEFFIEGTEPTKECDIHTPFGAGPPPDSNAPPTVRAPGSLNPPAPGAPPPR